MLQNNQMMNGNQYAQQNYGGYDRGNNKLNNRNRGVPRQNTRGGQGRGGYRNQNQSNQ